MNLDKAVFRIAGIIILISVLLSAVHTKYWLILTAFVAVNMLQATYTAFCPSAKVFKLFGIKPGRIFD